MSNTKKILTKMLISAMSIGLISTPLLAQVPSGTNIDELPDDPQQMKTWRCRQGDRAIVIEAKDVSISTWQGIIETQGWQCVEELSTISDDERTFSCESNNGVINIVTAIWLEGKGGKQQMQTWMNELQSKNMTCTADFTNQYWE
ncbi:hypothetical protein C7H19_18040 [Aphanothece hegewaldii CCALA 016]|uniref:Ig-like domain-containing protein n=1 Tax=Aphanothece hegewaldii CCALA 016 TaxID=2107694 RepID=A0A2T1LUA4_9CHRO|nr:hypothetical protein [Aphanothece hegewaldii]PSF35043.1 hypothetical protein C7H19_18040 [Aphanothece hegewaldii CCALA 016]